MAHFRAEIQGMRGGASRLGGEESGIYGNIHGWDSGIRVEGFYDKEKEKDVFVVTLTEGSGYNRGRRKEIGRFSADDLPSE